MKRLIMERIMHHLTVLWVIIVVILIAQINIYSNRLDAACDYINKLEEDFPQHLDITSGSDAYNNWYK